jgi:hypothetical protein
MTNLTDAIQLIRQGRKDDARLILEAILKLDTKNIPAWFWYVETLPTLEKRIQMLDVCLRMNPGNPQVLQALQTLRAQASPPSFSSPYPAASSTPARVDPFTSGWQRDPEPPQSTPAYDYGNMQPAASEYESDDYYTSATESESLFDDGSAQPSKSSTDFYPQPSAASKPAFDWDALERENAQRAKPTVDIPLPAIEPIEEEPEPPRRSYPFYVAWFTALIPWDLGAYASVLDDPQGGAGRAFEWMAITGVITGLISPFIIMNNPNFAVLRDTPEFRSLLGNTELTTIMIILMVGMTVLVPLLSILGLALNGAILNFLAMAFGGTGNFSRTVYAQGAYLAPMSLVSTLVTIIPGGQCVGSLLGLYSVVLNVRSLMAAHELTLWGAIKTLIAPAVILFVLGCVFNLVFGLTSLVF